MKKAVVPYQHRCVTIFCVNCGGIAIADMDRKTAERMSRDKIEVPCSLCALPFADRAALLLRYKEKQDAFRDMILKLKEEFQKDVMQINEGLSQCNEQLETIKNERTCERKWQAGLN